jgi:hypothetical protein
VILLQLSAGTIVALWAVYEFIRFFRTGEISAVGRYSVRASRDDPTFWVGLIFLANIIWLVAGAALAINAVLQIS